MSRRPRRRRVSAAVGEEQRAQVQPEVGFEYPAAIVDLSAHDRFGAVQVGGHARVLRALAGEHEDDREAFPDRIDWLRATRIQKRGHGVGAVVGRDHVRAPVREGPSSDVQGVGDVGEVEFGMAGEVCAQSLRRSAERRGAAGRQREQLKRPAPLKRISVGGFLDHGMRVRAADAERADAGAPRRAVARPRMQIAVVTKNGLEAKSMAGFGAR